MDGFAQRDVLLLHFFTRGDLREQLGDRRLRLTDDQRRRLAAKGKVATGNAGWGYSRTTVALCTRRPCTLASLPRLPAIALFSARFRAGGLRYHALDVR